MKNKKVTPDGREVKTLITLEGLTKMTQSQKDTKTSKHSAVTTRELKENKLIEVKNIKFIIFEKKLSNF